MQRIPKSLVMTPKFERRLAAVNGVVVASKIPLGGKLYNNKKSWTGTKKARMICSICGSACKDQRSLRDHFVTCVRWNGNPNGARWDDSLTQDAADDRYRRRYPSLKGPATAAAFSDPHSPESEKKNRKSHERLAAVNGVAIKSRSSAGQLLSSGPQDLKLEGLDPEGYEVDSFAFDSHAMENFVSYNSDGRHQQLASAPSSDWQPYHPDLQPANPRFPSPPISGLQPYDSDLETLDPQLIPSSSNGLEPYDLDPQLDLLTNQELLSLVQGWQDVINSGEEQYALEHPHFQSMMDELMQRGMMSASWRWTVNIEDVDMAWTRTRLEDRRAWFG